MLCLLGSDQSALMALRDGSGLSLVLLSLHLDKAFLFLEAAMLLVVCVVGHSLKVLSSVQQKRF